MLFFAISSSPLHLALDQRQLITGVVGTLTMVALMYIVSRRVPEEKRGVFIQGAYRGNLGVIGVAYCVAVYGQQILPMVAVYVAIITALYNVTALLLLKSDDALLESLRNPLIISIALGSLASWLRLPIPTVLFNTGQYVAAMALPTALICVGASLRLHSLRDNSALVIHATWCKLLLSPAILVALGAVLGLRNEQLGLVFFMAAAPTASTSYTMAQQLTSNGPLASEIVAVSIVFSVVSVTVGLIILRTLNVI